ncbi:tyrosine-type recombinase/integrase [Ancylobacter pratisalsi]|uniref:Integrase n=1 Tax=Ancylobacter pratisalsi TaxID=1745854 RepID=A0A6P1YRQ1_9HYPH|nr:tyrosine-type recombinase/integrase [Ancylobacter pratisalsi]QIB35802.1 integrase [Ancylobacter pratisalsi]
MSEKRPKPPGLKWRSRKSGERVAYWVARPDAVKQGFRPATQRLPYDPDDPGHLDKISFECGRLQAQMMAFQHGGWERMKRPEDGTVRSIINLYLHDEESPFHRLKHTTRRPYECYAVVVIDTVGSRELGSIDGRDVRRWFNGWAGAEETPKLARAQTCLAVLKSALSFGVMCRRKHCAELREIISVMRFPHPAPRKMAPSRAQIVGIRKAAHENGHPGIALAAALQFETMQRLWDVVGQWVPLADPTPSARIAGRHKWVGPQWSDIDQNMILRWKPTKTSNTTGVEIEVDLSVCRMVAEEMALVPQEQRVGPLIVDPKGRPYDAKRYQRAFREIARAAGIPDALWSRDIRAGGITDARMNGALIDDIAKAAGHTDQRTTSNIYNRDALGAHRRIAELRRSTMQCESHTDDRVARGNELNEDPAGPPHH